jgi:hypothetical protein
LLPQQEEVEKVDYKLFISALQDCSDLERQQGSLLSLSISILKETLGNAIWKLERPGQIQTPNYRTLYHERQLLTTHMLKTGWCKAQAEMLGEWTDSTGLYVASQMSRIHLSHENHASCRARTCLGNQIDAKTYRTQHRKVNCNCSHISVDVVNVCEVLGRGKIPRIIISKTDDGLITLHISENASYRVGVGSRPS